MCLSTVPDSPKVDRIQEADAPFDITPAEDLPVPAEAGNPGNITIYVKYALCGAIQSVKVPMGCTAQEFTKAETTLGTIPELIAIRSSMNTPIPMFDPLQDGQLVHLCEAFPDSEKCPMYAIHPKFPQINFPCVRMEALWNQLSWVAVDETQYYLRAVESDQIATEFPMITLHSGPGIPQHDLIEEWLKEPIRQAATSVLASVMLLNHHWTPVVLRSDAGQITLTTTPEGIIVLRTFLETQGIRYVTRVMPSTFPADCGFQAFAWIIAIAQDMNPEPLQVHQAEGWRKLFLRYLIMTDRHIERVESLELGGMPGDHAVTRQLCDLLLNHGVWQERVHERAAYLVQQIGITRLQTILTSKRAWSDLKAAATHHRPPIKIVMQDELDHQIKQRVGQTKSFGRKNAKLPRGTPTDRQTQVQAADLQIPPGIFQQKDGKPLASISAAQIGPQAQGVVLIDPCEADAMLKIPHPVTPHGLAIITLAPPDANPSNLIKFPALCTATQEAIIVQGSLRQLGQIEVCRHEPTTKMAVDEPPVDAIRCVVYQDQAGSWWKTMHNHPVRAIFDVAGFAPKDGRPDLDIIDVWDRQWVTARYDRCKPEAADMFIFMFRIQSQHTSNILAKSGEHCIFFEPRSEDGRRPNNDYHVTWLSGGSLADAKLACQTAPHASSLARHGHRYGIRCDAIHAQEVHKKHHPDTPLLLGAQKSQYTIGPLPYSTTREAVIKLLKAWNWEAKPLQPKGRALDGSGITWAF